MGLMVDGVVGHFSIVVCLMSLGGSRWCFSAVVFLNGGGLLGYGSRWCRGWLCCGLCRWVEAIGCEFVMAWVVRVSGLTCLCHGLRLVVPVG